eukprot:15378-Heterococcus_DN1.PRE.4
MHLSLIACVHLRCADVVLQVSHLQCKHEQLQQARSSTINVTLMQIAVKCQSAHRKLTQQERSATSDHAINLSILSLLSLHTVVVAAAAAAAAFAATAATVALWPLVLLLGTLSQLRRTQQRRRSHRSKAQASVAAVCNHALHSTPCGNSGTAAFYKLHQAGHVTIYMLKSRGRVKVSGAPSAAAAACCHCRGCDAPPLPLRIAILTSAVAAADTVTVCSLMVGHRELCSVQKKRTCKR